MAGNEASAERTADGWPFLGRDAELATIVRALDSGTARGVVLAGPAGVGKSRLAAEAAKRAAARGDAVHRLTGHPGLSAIPLGAIGSLADIDLDGISGPAQVLSRMAAEVIDRGAGRRVTIVLDDAHLLDEISAGVLFQLLLDERVFVVLTVRSGAEAPEPVVRCWRDGAAERIELPPLDAGTVERLVSTTLAGPLESATSRWLVTYSEGNPLYLRELVTDARSSGRLLNDGGLWRLTDHSLSGRLTALIADRLHALSEPQREVLTLVAVGEPVGLTLLEARASFEDLRTLERHGLLAVTEDGRRLDARLSHPLYGEVVRAQTPPVLLRRVQQALADGLEATGARRRSDPLRAATWRLDGGDSTRPEITLTAAGLARARGDLALAERLAVASIAGGAGFAAELAVAQLAWLRGRADEADQHLDRLGAVAGDDDQIAMVATTRMDVLAMGLGRVSAALDVGQAAEARVPAGPALDDLLAKRAQLLLQSGRTAEALAMLTPVLGRLEGRTLASASLGAATSLMLVGRLGEALDVGERGRTVHEGVVGVSPALGAHLHHDVRVMALLHAGRLTEAVDVSLVALDRALSGGSSEVRGTASLSCARAFMAQGNVEGAIRYGREAAVLLRDGPSPTFLSVALGCLAHALALAGHPVDAHAALDALDLLAIPRPSILATETLLARAWVAVADCDLHRAVEIIGDAVATARESGDRVLEAVALHDLARLGRADRATGDLDRLATFVEGPLMAARVRHATALASGDVEGLEAAADDFALLGAGLLAAETTAMAAAASGDGRRATALSRLAASRWRGCDGAVPTPLGVPPTTAPLTARELEVTTLVSRGLANKDVADRLHVSVRTVETQLRRAYEKLGVRTRVELADAMAADPAPWAPYV